MTSDEADARTDTPTDEARPASGSSSQELLSFWREGRAGAQAFPANDAPALEEMLAGLWERVRDAHPRVATGPREFLRYVAQRAGDTDPCEALQALSAEDLYLACACSERDPAALETFEETYLNRIDTVVLPATWGSALVEETTAAVRERVLFGKGTSAKIGEYQGRGSLWRWLRVIALREALQIRRRSRKRVQSSDDMLARMPADQTDPELAYLKAQYRSDFRVAFKEALGSLTSRQRNLLRYYYLDGLTIDQLADLDRIHRSTAARRLQTIRERLLAETRKRFRARLRIDRAEFESILRLIESQLDVSIRGFLDTQDD